MNKTSDLPLLSVCMMTYNHQDYIAEAVESVLMQSTTFPFELVIGEDSSTDKTFEICNKYKNLYPNIVRILIDERNIGMVPNFLRTFKNCRGKYIALLEGDDYWISSKKIQDQVMFLERNNNYSMVCHDAFIINYINEKKNVSFFSHIEEDFILKAEDIIKKWLVPTASVVFRKRDLVIPSWFHEIRNWDWAIQILLAHNGKVYYQNKAWSVYRKHIYGNSFNPDYSPEKTLNRQIILLGLLKNYLKKNEMTFNNVIDVKKKQMKKINKRKRLGKLYYPINLNLLFKKICKRLIANT